MSEAINAQTVELAGKMTDVARAGDYTAEQLVKALVLNLAAIVATTGAVVEMEGSNVTVIAKPTKEADNG